MPVTQPLPPVEELGPGLWSIPVPIPINPLRYVLVYALESAGGLVLVDVGWETPEAWRALTEGLASLGAGLSDVRGVLPTHIHPDHYGLAARVRERSGCWVALHPADAALIEERYTRMDRILEQVRAWLQEAGAPREELDDLATASTPVRPFVTVAEPDILLEDGDRAPVGDWDLVAIHTPGHSPGHLCFHERDRGVLFAGDHVLPRITPNVTVHPQSGPNPLRDFLESLGRVRDLEVALTAPAHEWRFADLARRVDELRRHHEERLEDVERVVAGGAETTYEIASQVRWSSAWQDLPPFMRRIAIGEAHAHLLVLAHRGRVFELDGDPQRWRIAGTPIVAAGSGC